MAKILIYGGGRAARTMIEMLAGDRNINITALAARELAKETAAIAEREGIPCFNKVKEVSGSGLDFDLILNLTGVPPSDLYELVEYEGTGVEIINSVSSKLIYDLLLDRLESQKNKESMINQLIEQKAYFQNILDDSRDMIIVTDSHGKITEYNLGAERILGYAKKEVLGKKASDFYINPEERQKIISKLKEDKFVADFETTLKRKDGTIADISLTISKIQDKKGGLSGTIGISKDITDKKIYENRLRELNENLENKVLERTRQLEESNKELSRANELKSRFIANMSHELRTPLNAIIGYSDLLLDSHDLGEKVNKYINNILVSGKHLLQLINNILDIAKIEAGRFSLDYSIFSIKDVLNEAISVLKSLAYKKNISINIGFECDEDYKIYADRVKFKQVIYNLLSNAIKFSFDGSQINIVCKNVCPISENGIKLQKGIQDRVLEYVQINVVNHGEGIPEAFKKNIFEEFSQADNKYSRQFEGTGLGLALTRKIIELHGGHIYFESISNDYTDFTFVIPNPVNSGIENIGEKGEEKIQVPVNARSFFNANMIKKNKPLVLVAEDDRASSELFTINLIKSGYSVVHAYDGIEALEKARELRPFAILLDIMLPKKDGWEVLNELKSDLSTKNVPVIITSMVDNKDLGFALGATDYLVKPVDKESLINTLSQFTLTSKKKRRQVNLLLIDDDPVIHETIENILVPEGFKVINMYNGEEGIKAAMEYKPDLILLDLVMPDKDGFEVAEHIKNHPMTSQIPIIVLTSKDLTVDERLKLSSNIQRIIGKKVFSPEELTRSIKELELLYPHKAGLFDEVTGLLDHNYFSIRLSQEISRGKRYDVPFSIIFADLDKFKNYFDVVGSFHADIALKKIADIFKKYLRGSDVIVRYGYDEFAIILINTIKDSASFVANRFKLLIEDYPFYKEEEMATKRLTSSFVSASFPEDGDTPEELISKIYNRLLSVKHAGGNAVAEAGDDG